MKGTLAAYVDDIRVERALRQAAGLWENNKKLEGLNITVNPKKTDFIIFSFQKNKRTLLEVNKVLRQHNELSLPHKGK